MCPSCKHFVYCDWGKIKFYCIVGRTCPDYKEADNCQNSVDKK